MTDLPKLRDEHFRLMITVRRLGVLIERREPPPSLHLSSLRHELSSTLIAHLEEEDSSLYPVLMASGDAQIQATARAFSDEMGGLADKYRDHVERWDAEAIAADWAGFCSDCRRILGALTLRIARENRDLYPLIGSLARAA